MSHTKNIFTFKSAILNLLKGCYKADSVETIDATALVLRSTQIEQHN